MSESISAGILKLGTMKHIFWGTCGLALVFCLTACGAGNGRQQAENFKETSVSEETENIEQTTTKMNVQIGESVFTAALEENEAVSAFVELMEEAPVVIRMSDYSGFEKVGSLGTSLPADNSQTTAQPGDIVLYNGNQIVIFYGSNSWSYTRLGKIDDLTGWGEALGSGDVTVTFSVN